MMKSFLLPLSFLLLLWGSAEGLAQVAVHRIPDQNLTDFDRNFMKTHKVAYDKFTSEDYVFKGREEQFISEWKKMIFTLHEFLKDRGINMTPASSCYFRIFFNQNGQIECLLYHPTGLDDKLQNTFDLALKEFALNYRMLINAPQAFWNFGNMNFSQGAK